MRYSLVAPRKKKGEPHKSTTEYCSKLTMTATDDLDELVVAIVAQAVVYRKDKQFMAWLQKRVEAEMKRLKLSIAN